MSLKKIFVFLKKPENQWFNVLATIALLFTFWALYQYHKPTRNFEEGFRTIALEESYSLKQGSDEIYDDFYADIFDYIVPPELYSQEVDAIVQNTQTNADTSIILDVGSQKGRILLEFKRRGYNNVYGIDKHKAMINQTNTDVVENVLLADVTEQMNFERATFSHVLCLHQTLYDQPDISIFFQNCRYWLKSGGTLVLHLVQYEKKTQPPLTMTIPQQNILYSRTVEIVEKTIVTKETFTDKNTNHVRQQEIRVHYQEIDRIINTAVYYGFTINGKMEISNKIVTTGTKEFLYFLTI